MILTLHRPSPAAAHSSTHRPACTWRCRRAAPEARAGAAYPRLFDAARPAEVLVAGVYEALSSCGDWTRVGAAFPVSSLLSGPLIV
ncbi:hypothetical protein PF011_g5176 [Phytophthora fragariae]|uniref:Uncharacterized protein n=1 Tax=Phytophthora fragariae TaxID=53985 RepID=A0A6A3LXB7_9STRA|nr:hypothetical protein PF011_g5176 [Phytophthora fragariae]